MIAAEIKLFELLKAKLGEKETEALVEFVDSRIKEANEQNHNILATKEDISRLELKKSETKVDLIKWMVALIIGLFLALVGSMTAIIKFIVH